MTAVDQRTAEDVVFDSAETRLTVDHLMASSALPIAFPAVEIDGRGLVDAGLSANLPVAALFRAPPQADTVCWAVDPWPPADIAAGSLDAVTRRAQDVLFATQSRHAVAAQGERMRGPLADARRGIELHHIVYDGTEREVAGKAFAYTAASLLRRRSGRASPGATSDPVRAAFFDVRGRGCWP